MLGLYNWFYLSVGNIILFIKLDLDIFVFKYSFRDSNLDLYE